MDKLNKAQKEAVEHSGGQLLIVAGAGTGKTTVITNKICHLVQNRKVLPEQILALTYNDKAAAELQERVDSEIDIGYTEIQISTFHAFCQKLVERYAIDIGLSNQFKLLTQTAAWLLVRKNFHKFELDYYRPIGNPYRHIHELLNHFSKCKDELISPEEYLAYAENIKANGDDAMNEEKTRLNEVANAYHTYNQLLRDTASMDFGDLIYYSYQILKTRPKILEKLQNQYKYILVDEFQDVNWAQYALIKLLTGKGTELTVVGDDDQSIYAFRGASVSNILHFKEDFPKAKEIVLTENYRSFQPILDTAYNSIQNNNPDRLEVKFKLDKKLESKRKSPSKSEKCVVHIHAKTADEETELVAKEIERLRKIDKSATWDDFAILVRANAHADKMIDTLKKYELPYEFISSTGLFREPIVTDSMSFLRIMENFRDDTAFYRLLSMPFMGVRERDIHNLTFFAKKKAISYFDALKRTVELDVSEEGKKAGEKIISVFNECVKMTKKGKTSAILYNFLEKIGYLNHLTKGEEQGDRVIIRNIYHLKQFFDFIEEFESVAKDSRVGDFLDHFELLSEAGDKGEFKEPSDTPDSINILTVHKAKGLEFKYVFIMNLVEDRFPTRRRGEGIEIPSELIHEKLPEGDSHLEEERRLFYVAVTRAKDRLYFTSAEDYGGERAKKISRFLNELGYEAASEVYKKEIKVLLEPKKIVEGKGEFVYELPKTFSFSNLKAYETCPYKYKLSHILKLPTRSSAALSFGSTIHNTLQEFYSKMIELNQAEQVSLFSNSSARTQTATMTKTKLKVPTIDQLISIYESRWIDDWYESEFQKDKYFKKGKEVLKIFYSSQEENWVIPEEMEKAFKIKIGDHVLSGRIDRIDRQPDGTLEIIDYKTGKSKEKLTSEDKDQLLIYQIAVEQLPEFKHLGKPGKLTFYYLEDDLRTSFVGEDKDIEKLKTKVLATIESISRRDFTAKPSEFSCKHCDFKDICDFRV